MALQLRGSCLVFEGQHNDDGKELKIRVCSYVANIEPGIAATGSICVVLEWLSTVIWTSFNYAVHMLPSHSWLEVTSRSVQ
jgi:hypothetical protein